MNETQKKIAALKARHKKITDEIIEMSKDEHFDDEKQAKYDALIADADQIGNQIKDIEYEARHDISKPTIQDQIDMRPALGGADYVSVNTIKPVTSGNKPRCLTGTPEQVALKAMVARKYFMALKGDVTAALWMQQHNIGFVALHSEGSNTAGGYLVPSMLAADIIKLMDEYGVFRQYSRKVDMTTDTLNVPRRTSGFTAVFVGEGQSGTSSTKGWDLVSLVAKKIMVLTTLTNELLSDSQVNLMDDFLTESADAMAEKEDRAGFLGDGTSTYGGIVGVTTKLYAAAGSPTTTSAGGIIVGAGNLLSELTLANHATVIGKCPAYARRNAKWYCSGYYHGAVMTNLLSAAGGNTVTDLQNGTTRQMFLGYPVVLSETLPASDANTQIACLFGDLAQASTFGDRQMMAFAMSDSATVDSTNMFETDSVAVRATERLDINVHDVGTTTAAGPIVGLLTAAS
jgi:HK97 family phage major capsid protein